MTIPNNYTYSPIDFNKMMAEKITFNINELFEFIKYYNSSYQDILLLPYNNAVKYPIGLLAWYKNIKTNLIDPDLTKEALKWFKSYYENFDKKIKNYSSKYNLDKDYILDNIANNYTFAINFITDPSRQTSHQIYAAEWIEHNLFFIKGFHILPAGGESAKYVIDGKIESNHKNETGGVKTKSIDFEWYYEFNGKKLNFYASHKYTKDCGGSQDNQFKDADNFLTEGQRNQRPKEQIFVVITDGPYYTRCDKVYPDGKLQYFKDRCTAGTMATSCKTIYIDVINRIQQWLKDMFPNNQEAANEILSFDKIKKYFKI